MCERESSGVFYIMSGLEWSIVGNVWGDSSGSVTALRKKKVGQDGERTEKRVTENKRFIFLSLSPSQITRWLNSTLPVDGYLLHR